ncbi:MAG: hypothetical protein HXY35_02030 [Chloroflexi bacterium]|nr:hypothetical protein [Chloroflexota bacterium]
MFLVKGIIGGVILFLGRELNFLFAGAMAFLIGQRLTPLLPAGLPGWADYAFMAGLGILAAALTFVDERGGFALSGFLAGGYVMAEYFVPNALVIPVVPFFVGGVLGALILGIFTEWALIIVSSIIGGFYLTTLFRLAPTPRVLITAGLVIIGAVTQAIIMRQQKQ